MKTDILTDQKPTAAKNAGLFKKLKKNPCCGITDDCKLSSITGEFFY